MLTFSFSFQVGLLMGAYSDSFLRSVLERTRTIAVVGLSDNPSRPSHQVARYLQGAGYRIVPVNPGHAGKCVLGEVVYASLAQISAEVGPIEMVDIFRRSEQAGAVVDEALDALIDRGISAIWMQIGVVDTDAARRAEAAGVDVVMDRCPKIELARLGR
jgi:uncharacterized protein